MDHVGDAGQQGPGAVGQGEAGVAKWTFLHNQLKKISKISSKHANVFKIDDSNVQYRTRCGEKKKAVNVNAKEVVNRPQETQAKITFGGSLFYSKWYGKKNEARDDVAGQVIRNINNMTYDGDVLGGLGRVECINTHTLQVQPEQLWWERELAALGLHKKKNKKSHS